MRLSQSFLGITAAFIAAAALGAVACGEEDATVRPRLNGTGEDGGNGDGGALGCGAPVLASYDAPNFATNAQAEIALGKSVDDLDAKMASTEGANVVTVTSGELSALYSGGSLSLRGVATNESQALVDGYLLAFGNAQGKTWEPANAQADGGAPNGGKFKALFYESATGVDLRAATNKAILGGSLYKYALLLISQGITSDAQVDKLLAVFGATPAFANSTDVNAGANGDRLVAALASKRDDKTGTGIYAHARHALLTMKAAATNPACTAEIAAAVSEFKTAWEQATYASAIYALNAASDAASKANGPLALHSYGEALGLIQSFKGIPADQRKIQDQAIDTLVTGLHPEAAYILVTDPSTRVADLTSAINNIKLFEFENSDIEPFKTNH